jgi:hypothetical protein
MWNCMDLAKASALSQQVKCPDDSALYYSVDSTREHVPRIWVAA